MKFEASISGCQVAILNGQKKAVKKDGGKLVSPFSRLIMRKL
jgi:hypothetical protein